MWRLKVATGGGPYEPYLYSTNNFVGRQIWEFDPNYDEDVTYEAANITLKRALRFFCAMQTKDGHWAAEIAGPLFFLPPLVMYGPFGGRNNAVERGRKWIHDHGGVVAIPSWGKTWLSIFGLFDWSGCIPMPPEFWILPSYLPMHPAKMWCYCRMTYMPMSYLYGKRFVGPITDLVKQLRKELHSQPYDEVNWKKYRHACAKEDLYHQRPLIQDLMWDSLYITTEPLLARWPFNKLREKALAKTMEHIHYEDEVSRYITIGCVEKVLCMLCCWVEDPNGDYYKKHLAKILMSFGSQQWDTSLSVQAILACNMLEETGEVLRKGHDFIKKSQVKDNPSGDFKKMFKHISKGSWTFSDQDHGWQVSDCTAEGFKCCLLLSQLPPEIVGEKHEAERLYDVVNVILSLQLLNPTENFADIVIEHEYGNWGVCFTYGTWFALGGLVAAGKTYNNCAAIRNGVEFLLLSQRDNGGWGESYLSSPLKKYVPLEENRANLVHTSWAMMGLIHSGQAERDPRPLH
ncbi:Beta-amyrin synthase 1 [Camellia lanceoleosa]|uniref:Beta-amyrin synthase 1 n=1 Tax=Camellia lanceoleosa TaxID=1840588 RepID=A0ACC0GDJ3_9ERIC|nr:Beta-amyrin synthase 1 [Camellia lanceoleosa]